MLGIELSSIDRGQAREEKRRSAPPRVGTCKSIYMDGSRESKRKEGRKGGKKGEPSARHRARDLPYRALAVAARLLPADRQTDTRPE